MVALPSIAAPAASPALSAALDYAAAGLAVFPCRTDKAPLTPRGFHDATTDPAQIAEWWRRWPDALIGLPTTPANGIAVVDLDVDKATGEPVGEDEARRRGWLDMLGSAPSAKTPSGGRHFYLRHPGPSLRRRIKAAPGIDLLGDGGYVVAPGAGAYAWTGPGQLDRETLPDLPAEILAAAERRPDAPEGAAPAALPARVNGHTSDAAGPDEARELLGYIDPDAGGYGLWCEVLMALHDHFDGSSTGLQIAFEWSARGVKYKAGEVEKKWRSFTPGGGITFATVCALARQGGADLSAIRREHMPEIDRGPGTADHGAAVARRLIESAGEPTEARPASRVLEPLILHPFAEDAEPYLEDAWLVEGVLPEQGLGVIFGAPGSRKTFTALDLVLHLASDLTQWRDRRVERRMSIYLSLEGGKPFKNRLAAWRLHHGREASLFYRCTERLDLRARKEDAQRVIDAGKQLERDTGERVGIVVVDTLNRAMPGGNENAVEDMGAFIALCDAIARELGCLVLIVHHSGKDAAKGSRGHSSLLGAIDTEICIADGVMTITKQRDGEDGLTFGVDLKVVEVGTTARGRAVTSCVAVETDGKVQISTKPLTRDQQHTLEALREYVAQNGSPNPAGTGWPEFGTRQIVETEAVLAFLAGKQTSSVPSERKKQAGRKLGRLVEHGIVQTNEGFTWLVR